jgi:hypothetical protein
MVLVMIFLGREVGKMTKYKEHYIKGTGKGFFTAACGILIRPEETMDRMTEAKNDVTCNNCIKYINSKLRKMGSKERMEVDV